jgi:hypothetical protein
MRFFVLVFALLVTAFDASASVIPMYPPPNIAGTPAGYITTGPVTMTSTATAVEMRAAVGWGSVMFPATMTIGEGAAAVAIAVMRATPAIATASMIAYAAQIGIQKCLDGTWCKKQTPAAASDNGFDGSLWISGNKTGASPVAACSAYVAVAYPGMVITGYGGNGFCQGTLPPGSSMSCGGGVCNIQVGHAGGCVTGYVASNGSCVTDPNAPLVPATDADWNKGLTYPVPPAAATDLSAAKAPVPVNIQLTNDPATGRPAPKTVTLGDSYVDPVTGKTYRDVAVVTPNADGKTATVTTARQEVDANGNPVTDPATGGGKAPEPQTDPCSGHETRLGCMEMGDTPQGPDLKENTVNVSITPDGGWGADNASCPSGSFSVRGFSFAVPWSPVCSFAGMIRPLVIALGWLAAAFIVVGARQGGGGE